MGRVAAALVVFSMVGSVGVVARAESIDGRVRLGLEGGLIEHQVTTRTEAATPSFGSSERETDVKFTTVGLGSLPFGPIIGYGLSNNVMLVGQLSIAHQNRKFGENESTDVLGAGVSATVAYVADTGSVRPFFGPLIGFEHSSSDSDSFSASDNIFDIGAQVGLLGFAASSFSIDPSVVFVYGIGGGSQQNFFQGDPNSGAEQTHDLNGFSIGLRLAMSGWIGGERQKVDADPDRDLDSMPEYAPPPGWGQPPSQQPAYPPAPPPQGGPPGAPPAYYPPPTYAPPGGAPPAYPPPPAPAQPPPPAAPAPSQAFPPPAP